MLCLHSLRFLPLALLVGLAGAPLAQDVSDPRPGSAWDSPNLVVLLTDDQCFDSLGCYGNPDVSTPEIDGLAADGVCFDRHYVSTAICMASRAAIVTGLHEYRHGCNFGRGNLARELWERSYPMRLRAAGYRTAMAGKIGFVVADDPSGKGELPVDDFDVWGAGPGQTHYETAKNPSIARYAEEFPHSSRAYGAFGRDFIAEAVQGDAPFCLSISFKAPHRPTTPDPAFDDLYGDTVFRKRGNHGREQGMHFAEQSRRGRQYPRFESWGYSDRFDEVMAVYHRQIRGVDAAVGMIRRALAEHGVAENTVIVFTSDNGFLCGAHGYGSKVLPYEESARVPLIVFDPRRPEDAGTRRAALTSSVDLAPSLVAWAGLEPDLAMDGLSLLPLLADPAATTHEAVPLINVWGPRATFSLSVVTATAKYVFWPYADEGLEATEELFDLAADPLELVQRADGPDQDLQLLEEMRAHHQRFVTDWKARAVPWEGYRDLGRFFDRDVAWADKASIGR